MIFNVIEMNEKIYNINYKISPTWENISINILSN